MHCSVPSVWTSVRSVTQLHPLSPESLASPSICSGQASSYNKPPIFDTEDAEFRKSSQSSPHCSVPSVWSSVRSVTQLPPLPRNRSQAPRHARDRRVPTTDLLYPRPSAGSAGKLRSAPPYLAASQSPRGPWKTPSTMIAIESATIVRRPRRIGTLEAHSHSDHLKSYL